jgi:hypothetical protein
MIVCSGFSTSLTVRSGGQFVAVRKKGSRRITVDGVMYLWRFPPRQTQSQEDGWPGVGVTISREDCRRASLLLGFPRRFHLSGPFGQDSARPVLPSDVARGIRAALMAGWQADQPGPQFVYRVQEDGEQRAASDRPRD